MGAFTRMTSKGQLTIPKDVREALRLSTGTRFFVTVRDGDVVAVPRAGKIADLAGALGQPPKGNGATLDDIERAIGDAVGEDDARIRREWLEGQR
jgi:antitoxin PrlF